MEALIEAAKSLPWPVMIVVVALPLVFGGTVSIGLLKVDMRGVSGIRRWLMTTDDFAKRVGEFRSYFVTTIVLTVTREGGQIDATIHAAGSKAAQFFGYAGDLAHELIGKGFPELAERLRRWVDERDFHEFALDQAEVQRAILEERPAIASVPIRFNRDHPFEVFRGRVFYPIIVYFTERSREQREKLMTVLYFDITELPDKAIGNIWSALPEAKARGVMASLSEDRRAALQRLFVEAS